MLISFHQLDEFYMAQALFWAGIGAILGEVPVGAVVVLNGCVIGYGFNCPILQKDASAHAEIVAVRMACKHINNYRLNGASIYITLEPCTMCFGALIHARLARMIIGTLEPKAGALSHNIANMAHFNHLINYQVGIGADKSALLLRTFFANRRRAKKTMKFLKST